MAKHLLCFLLVWSAWTNRGSAQIFSHGDSLRGANGKARQWWDVQFYNLDVNVNIARKSIKGINTIYFNALDTGRVLQIDLQEPLRIDSIRCKGRLLNYRRDGNAWMVQLVTQLAKGASESLKVYYSGEPRQATMPPWDGGFVWRKDSLGRPWVGVACQGTGASVWWPNKDYQGDEPDKGLRLSVTIPDSLQNISNGRLKQVIPHNDHTATWVYEVTNPINNYDVTLNIGKYITVKDSIQGLNGKLDIEYAVLDYNAPKVASHLQQETRQMLQCFEYWFGPYPFYADGYRLVESSYLGMEHQSAVAYGNKFRKGYLGMDRSGSGVGLFWDFIIIHESGHEWFGNNITAKDIADMWIQEAFTTYSEALYIECRKTRDTASIYVRGLRRNIQNDRPIIGAYQVNNEGSGDMYDKGANMIHTIRQIVHNDTLFRELLQGLNREFGKKTVTTQEIEGYINQKTKMDFSAVFDQYLRTTAIPYLEYRKTSKNKAVYRWTGVNANFRMPLRVSLDGGKSYQWLQPSTAWQELKIEKSTVFTVDPNFYIRLKS